jgi:hypothetical protein
VGIFFDPYSLLKTQRVIRRLVFNKGSITQEQLAKILVWVRSSSVGATTLRLDKLQFNGVRIVMPGLVLGPLRGQLELAEDSSLKRAWVVMSGQQGIVMVYPNTGGGYRIEAAFQHWLPPGFPKWEMDSLRVDGVLAGDRFTASNFSADMLGASIRGAIQLEWLPQWKAEVRVDSFDGQLEGLLPLLGSHVDASGALHVSGHLAAQGATASELPGNIELNLDVGLKNAAVRLPLDAKHKLMLDSASSHVTGTPQKLVLNKLRSKLYGGTLNGMAVVQHVQRELAADVTFGNISLQPLVEALNRDVLLTGKIDGKAKLSVQTNGFSRFPANVQLDGRFQARHGVIGKVDLVQAASNPLKGGNKGGKTSFDALSGLLSIDSNGYHFRRLKVSSGAVNAAGNLDISPQLQLHGMLDTDLKGTASLVSMPLVVSGTVRTPVLLPSGSVLAGAAVGTALLGPGLGTALGIKIGNLLHKLLGRDNDKAQPEKQGKPAGSAKPAPQPK